MRSSPEMVSSPSVGLGPGSGSWPDANRSSRSSLAAQMAGRPRFAYSRPGRPLSGGPSTSSASSGRSALSSSSLVRLLPVAFGVMSSCTDCGILLVRAARLELDAARPPHPQAACDAAPGDEGRPIVRDPHLCPPSAARQPNVVDRSPESTGARDAARRRAQAAAHALLVDRWLGLTVADAAHATPLAAVHRRPLAHACDHQLLQHAPGARQP
jgi:hypothetical protein